MRLPWTRDVEEREREKTETRLVQERVERVMASLRETLDDIEESLKHEVKHG